jgi:hypothetical protein
MKKLIVILLALSAAATAQNLTAVSGSSVKNKSGASLLPAGQICFLGTNDDDVPISYQEGGGGIVGTVPKCGGITNGVITGFNVANPANTQPANIKYRITVKDSNTQQIIIDLRKVQFVGSPFNFDNYQPQVGTMIPISGNNVSGNLAVSGNLTVTGSISWGSAPSIFYQTLLANSVARTQRTKTNFATDFTLADDAVNLETDVSLATVGIAKGGTGQTTATLGFNALDPLTTLGDVLYHNGTDSVRLAGNITTTLKTLCQTGGGAVSAAPTWCQLASTNLSDSAQIALRNAANSFTVAGQSIAGGTITSSNPALSLTETWNANVVFTGFIANMTCASVGVNCAAGSLLMDLQKGGTSQFKVQQDGMVTMLGRLNLGGATSSFSALKGNGVVLESKLADDSAYSTFKATDFLVSGSGSSLKTGSIILIIGADNGPALTTSDDQASFYANRSGTGEHITEVYCECDAGSPTINLQKDDGTPTNMLSADLTCSTSGASTTTFVAGEDAIANTDRIDYLTVTASTAKRITVVMKKTKD